MGTKVSGLRTNPTVMCMVNCSNGDISLLTGNKIFGSTMFQSVLVSILWLAVLQENPGQPSLYHVQPVSLRDLVSSYLAL